MAARANGPGSRGLSEVEEGRGKRGVYIIDVEMGFQRDHVEGTNG